MYTPLTKLGHRVKTPQSRMKRVFPKYRQCPHKITQTLCLYACQDVYNFTVYIFLNLFFSVIDKLKYDLIIYTTLCTQVISSQEILQINFEKII